MKVNNASQCIENAKQDLDVFRDKLGNIRDMEDLCFDVDGFLTFADFFFDGFLADIFVQSKIRDGQKKVRKPSGEWKISCGRCGEHRNSTF